MKVHKIGWRKYIISTETYLTNDDMIRISKELNTKYPKHKITFLSNIK